MIKLMVLLKRKAGLTREEFSRRWLESGSRAGKMLRPWLRGYIQDHAVGLEGAGEPAVDGLSELYLDDWQSLQAMSDYFLGDAARTLRDEEDQFLDTSATAVIPVDQKFMVKPSGGIKVIALLKRRRGTTHQQFSRHWEDIHGPLCVRMLPWFTGYVQDHCLAAPGAAAPYLDGLDEMWVADLASWQALLDFYVSEAGRPMRDDEAKFVDTSSVRMFRVEQKHILGGPGLEAVATSA